MNTKRIAIIIDTLNGGGAERVCLSLFEGILSKGVVDVHMIVLKQRCDYDLPQLDNIHFLFSDDKVSLSNYFIQKKAAKKLNSFLKELGGFDAYLSNLDITHAIVAKAKLPNCFYVVHNSIEKSLSLYNKVISLKYWKKRNAIRALNDKRLITVSDGIKNEILSSRIVKPLDITTIYNPIDIANIQTLANEYDVDIPKHDYILFVGRIANQKRVDVLIKAFQHVKTDLHLVVLTNNQKKLNKLLLKHNTNNKTIIGLGFKQNPYPLMKNAKALVLSSDFEGLGMVLIEALACNTAVVSTNCNHGPNEILTGDLKQFLCPVGSIDELAEKIDLVADYQISSPAILKKVDTNVVVEQYLNLII